MNELDLHGIPHERVALEVESFVCLHDEPYRIITGNSPVMRGLVTKVLKRYNLTWQYENDWNLGAIIVHADL